MTLPQLQVIHAIRKVNNQYTYSHSVPTQPFSVSLSVLYSINYIRYLTLYYKIGFVLEDFAQLWANVSVMMFGRLGVFFFFNV